MIKKLDHIGIAVNSLDAALDTYKRIYGLEAIRIEVHKDTNLKVGFIRVGDVLIELLEPIEPGLGRIGQFLKEKGEGFHHIAFRVDDIDLTISRLNEIEVPLRDKQPRGGADKSRIAFIEPACTQNVLTELVERKQEVKGNKE